MVACKASKKASSNLAKTANDALVLMDTAPSSDCKTPSFFAQLLFLKAFSKAFYENAYKMSMRCDPKYGRASHGYTSRHCVERCYVMKKQLGELKSGWKTHPDFLPYLNAIAEMPELGKIDKGGKEFFEQVPVLFFSTFLSSYQKLVETCWLHPKIQVYECFTTPALAQIYILSVAHDGRGGPGHGDVPVP